MKSDVIKTNLKLEHMKTLIPVKLKILLNMFLVVFSAPVLAFGDPAQAGAAAWCGARQRGASIDEANRQLRKTMSAQIMMSTGFASGLVGILNNRAGLQSQIDYHISTMCPSLVYGGNELNKPTGGQSGPLENPSNASYCSWQPWDPKCKDTATPDVKKKNQQGTSCGPVLQKYNCKYMDYLQANPSIKNWAIANPAIAAAEAKRLQAMDSDSLNISSTSAPKPNSTKTQSNKQLETKCLKASDYKGCMEYHKNTP
jgi:hypothetical protein